jgi:hypothetical protein
MSTQYLILIICISCLFDYMSLGFIARGLGLAAHLLGYHGQLFLHYWGT